MTKFVFKKSIESADEFAFYRSKIKAALVRGSSDPEIRIEFANVCKIIEEKFVKKQLLLIKFRRATNKEEVFKKIVEVQKQINELIVAINEQFFLEIIKGDFCR